jgi:hypothetical protein
VTWCDARTFLPGRRLPRKVSTCRSQPGAAGAIEEATSPTDTPTGAVVSVEHIKVISGRIASVLLVFERLHWSEVLAELAERAASQVAKASA